MRKSNEVHDANASIELQAKAALSDRLAQVDENVERQLAQIRQQALAQLSHKSATSSGLKSSWLSRFGLRNAGLATACSAALVAVVFFQMQATSPSQQAVTTMIALHEMNEDPELLNELEFIYWLSEQNEQVLL